MHKTYSLGENTPQLAESVALKSTVVKCHSANHNHIYNNSILPLNLFTTPLKPGKNLWWQILFNPSLAPTLSSSCGTSQVQRTLIDTTHHTFHPQVRDMFHPQTGVFLEKLVPTRLLNYQLRCISKYPHESLDWPDLEVSSAACSWAFWGPANSWVPWPAKVYLPFGCSLNYNPSLSGFVQKNVTKPQWDNEDNQSPGGISSF